MLIVNVIILIISLLAILISSKYQKELIKNENSKELKIPLALWLVDKLKIAEHAKSKVKDELANLSVYKNVTDVVRIHYCKKISLVIVVTLVCNVICICDCATKKEDITKFIEKIQRPDYGESDKEVELNVRINNEEEQLKVNLSANQLNNEERKSLIKNVKSYIDKELIGKNTSYKAITKKLNLVNNYPQDENIEIMWLLDDTNCVNEKGYVKNVDKDIRITALINYFDYEEKYEISLSIRKSNEVENDEICEKIAENINKQSENYSKDGEIILPDSVDNVKINYIEKEEKLVENISYFIIILGVIVCVVIMFFKDKEISEKMSERKESLMIDYPEILNRFALLMSAGFTIKKAWIKICCEYKNNEMYEEIPDRINTSFDILLEDNFYEDTKENTIVMEKKNDKEKLKKNNKRHNKLKKQGTKTGKRKKNDIKKEKKIKYVYEEMLYTLKEMYNGKSEVDAYEDFGKRLGLIQYMKLSSLFIQNIMSGVSNIVGMLELEALEAHKEKRECIKQYGEKIGTKMLVPIIGLLIVTLTIIVVPIMLVSL